MASVRITHNWRNPNKMEWAGAPELDDEGRIERSLQIPEEVYQAIERALAGGQGEGTVALDDGTRFQWFADR
jgi:hypothetical protein